MVVTRGQPHDHLRINILMSHFFLISVKLFSTKVSQVGQKCTELKCNSRLTAFHECHAPVNTLSETFTKKGFGNISLWIENGADKVGIIHGFQYDFDVTLQETRLNKEASLFRERNNNWWIGFAIRIKTEAGASDATYHQSDVLEAWQEECSDGWAVTYMLDDRTDWLTSLKINKVSRVLDLPNNATLSWRLTTEAALALTLCLIFKFNQSLKFGRASHTFTTNLEKTFADSKLGDVREIVGILAYVDDTIIAGCIGFAFGLEENFFADQQVSEEFTRFPGPWLIFRGIISGTSVRRRRRRREKN